MNHLRDGNRPGLYIGIKGADGQRHGKGDVQILTMAEAL